MQLVAVLRGGRVLIGPNGELPSSEELLNFLTPIDVVELQGVTLVKSSLGNPPADWAWTTALEVQRGMPPNLADVLGEALLCHS